jgi:hypothetical protein
MLFYFHQISLCHEIHTSDTDVASRTHGDQECEQNYFPENLIGNQCLENTEV